MPPLQGQVSRDDVAALCVELLEQPAALNTTFEVCSSSSPAGETQDLKVHGSVTWTAFRAICKGCAECCKEGRICSTVSAVLACLTNKYCRLAHQLTQTC